MIYLNHIISYLGPDMVFLSFRQWVSTPIILTGAHYQIASTPRNIYNLQRVNSITGHVGFLYQRIKISRYRNLHSETSFTILLISWHIKAWMLKMKTSIKGFLIPHKIKICSYRFWPELSNNSCKCHQAKVNMATLPQPSTICMCLWSSFASSQIYKVLQIIDIDSYWLESNNWSNLDLQEE